MMEPGDLSEKHVAFALARTYAKSAAGPVGGSAEEAFLEELFAGRWAIVETFEEGGRRTLVLRRNGSGGGGRNTAFTVRQRKIAARAALGHSSKRIAVELGLSESTVSGHVNRVAEKLGLGSRLELVGTLAALRSASIDRASR